MSVNSMLLAAAADGSSTHSHQGIVAEFLETVELLAQERIRPHPVKPFERIRSTLDRVCLPSSDAAEQEF